MSKTIVALYDSRTDAEAALRALEAEGFERSAIDITGQPGSTAGTGSPPLAGDTTGTTGGFLSRLTGWGIPERDAHVYAEGIRRGGSLLTLRVDEDDVDRGLAVLERGSVVDIEERGTAYRDSGWAGYDETSPYYDERSAEEERARYVAGRTTSETRLGDAAEALRDTNLTGGVNAGLTGTTAGREEHIPIVEEQINVGKRTVERGGVRVRSYIVETPVEEQVRLRDETVTVERRPATGTGTVPQDAFRERTIEVTETDEEAVVEKVAVVRENVVIRKDVEERAETVRDTVRRTEVEIDDDRTSGVQSPGTPLPGADRPLGPDVIKR